jgi:CRP/FNR family transcriptional regulator
LREEILAAFLDHLPEELRPEARRLFLPEKLDRDQYIFIEQDEAAHLYLVEEGVIEINLVHGDGKVYVINFLHPGDIFGESALLDEAVHPYSASARESSLVWRIARGDLRRLVEKDGGFALFLLARLAEKMERAYFKERCIVGERVEKRVACILLKMVNETGISHKCGQIIDLPLTNRDIAGLVGSTEETVSRIMSRLKKEEIITTEDRMVVVKDRKALLRYFDGL